MKRFVAALAGILGIAWLRRRSAQAPPAPSGPDPAEELRAKLAEARAAGDDRDAFESGETPVDAAPDPEARRRAVHDEARRAIDELGGD